jgi:type VI secretion system secreted protein Hcp
MEVEGVEGSVTAKGYEKWIALESINFAVQRYASMEVGDLSNRNAALPNFSEISVTKQTENATYGLLHEVVLADKAKPKIKIAVVEPGKEPVEYILYTLGDVIFSGYSMSAGADGRPHESINISYAKIEIAFTTHDKANEGGGVPRIPYDLAKASG